MKDKILNILKKNGDYISGEDMSRTLGISRAAIWKHINNLKKDGYDIISVTRKGYMLRSAPDVITPDKIYPYLNTRFMARNIKCYKETDSTNEAAKSDYSCPDGTVFISEVQTAGKGRLGRSWLSPRGSGIWMTVLLKPEIPPMDVSQLTLISGIALCRAIGGKSKIKWPNDIVIGAKKVCGILTEMSAEADRINYVVCGIGINVNTKEFPAELSDKATSILIETGNKTDRCNLIAKVMNEFEPLYNKYIQHGFSSLVDEYKKNCVTLGKEVKVIYRRKEIKGKAIDISSTGGLIIDTAEGILNITSGEVSVRGLYGYI
ncbi:MAG: biotin--[Clostridia bacterium]|nr:biotin--[acetyl-CoA-carboxylase] ligase [Clostridia bacterium]